MKVRGLDNEKGGVYIPWDYVRRHGSKVVAVKVPVVFIHQ